MINKSCEDVMQDLIARYYEIKPWQRSAKLDEIRNRLKEQGFYLLDLDQRNEILEQAKLKK